VYQVLGGRSCLGCYLISLSHCWHRSVQHSIGVGLRIVVGAPEKQECQRGSGNGSAGNKHVNPQGAAARRSGMRQIDSDISVEI
jgi:hypothetical protein